MKLLIVADNYYPNVNGAAYAALRLAEGLALRGQEVRVLTVSRNGSPERYEHNGVPVYGIHSMPFGRIRVPVPFLVHYDVRKVFDDYKPDVVHVEGHYAAGKHACHIAKERGIGLVATNHFMPENLTHYAPIGNWGRKVVRYFAWKHFVKVYSQADIVTTPTKTAAELLHSIGLKNPVEVISNGIDLTRFCPARRGTEVSAHYNLPDEPRLLYVGRLDLEKNIALVIRAFAKARGTATFHLVLAGSGAEEERLKKLARALKIPECVTFTGFVPDELLPELYASCDAFMMAGTAELQSIVTMEAMASGLPVIAVNAIALPELVDETNGFLYEHNDVETLAEDMRKLFTDHELYKKLREGSLKRIKLHSEPLIIDKYQDAYRRVLSSAP